MKSIKQKKKKLFVTVFLIFIFVLCLRLFVFEIYYVTSNSMEDTLHKGDIIVIEKLSYGARIPASLIEVPWLNIIPYVFGKSSVVSKLEKLPFNRKRLKAFSNIKRNDVIVFNDPDNYNEYMVKRCVGIPMDIFEIQASKILVNKEEVEDYKTVKKEYNIQYLDMDNSFSKLMNSLNIDYHESWLERRSQYKKAILTNEQKSKISEIIDSGFIKETQENFQTELILYSGFQTKDYLKYYKTFKKYEHSEADSIVKSDLLFNNDYYFFMGDNRAASFDSRSYGVIPNNLIVGKAVLILFSKSSNGHFRRDRFLKKIV